jgi:HD-GYP domain-containing protein (c-di-GMP phosphodiesterase class II)
MEAIQSSGARISISLSKLPAQSELDSDIYAGAALLLRAGTILTPQLIAGLERRGLKEVQISAESRLAAEALAEQFRDDSADGLAIDGRQGSAFDVLLSTAAQIYREHGIETAIPEEMLQQATDDVAALFEDIEKGGEPDLASMRSTVTVLVEQFFTRPSFAVKLLDLENFDHYTYRHSINVGLLMLSVAQDWYTREEQLVDVVYGALLHDVGKAKVGSAIINKQGKLDEHEWELMRKHPIWSEELLRETEATATARALARWHHERLDGSGYPDGLRGEQMVREVRLSGIVDVYDALTTKRSYKPKMDFGVAIGIIVQDCGRHFDPTLANQFIRRIGRYPVGSFVRLSTGDIAVVKEVHTGNVTRPTVSLVLDSQGHKYVPTELDLRNETKITIISILSSDAGEQTGV